LHTKEAVLKVKDLMTRNLVSVDADATVMETAELMVEKGITSLLVRHGEDFSGIVTDRDIIGRVVSKGADSTRVRVGEIMSSPLLSINEDATIEEAATKMRDNQVRRLIVVSDHHSRGMITESDMVRVTPELHFLIRERSRLEAALSSTVPREMTLAGFCEECENHSAQLRNVNGRWLCEDCMGG